MDGIRVGLALLRELREAVHSVQTRYCLDNDKAQAVRFGVEDVVARAFPELRMMPHNGPCQCVDCDDTPAINDQ